MRINIAGLSVSLNNTDPQPIANWRKPKDGRLKSMRFYPVERDQFQTNIYLSYNFGRDKIFQSPCALEWKSNFVLVEGSSQSTGTIPVYHYEYGKLGVFTANFFLHKDVRGPEWLFIGTHYIPDMSGYVGD